MPDSETEDQRPEKWKYVRPEAPKKAITLPASFSLIGIIKWLVKHILILGLSVIVPAFCLFVLDWVVYFILKDTFYTEPLIKPIIILLATLAGGIICRQFMETNIRSMGMLFFSIIGFCLFAYLILMDMEAGGGLLSGHYLPTGLRISQTSIIGLIPVSGMVGMLVSNLFKLSA